MAGAAAGGEGQTGGTALGTGGGTVGGTVGGTAGGAPASVPRGGPSDAVLVRTTYGDRPDAEAAARRFVEGGLAACAHIQQVRSCYRWQGVTYDEDEWALELRTTLRLRDALVEAVAARHPYEVPLVEAWTVGVAPAYGAWMREVTA